MRYVEVIEEYISEPKTREVAVGLWSMCRDALFPQAAQPEALATTVYFLLVGFASNPVWVKYAPTLVPLLTSTAQTTKLYHQLARAGDESSASKALSLVLANTTSMMLALYSEQPRSDREVELFRKLMQAEI